MKSIGNMMSLIFLLCSLLVGNICCKERGESESKTSSNIPENRKKPDVKEEGEILNEIRWKLTQITIDEAQQIDQIERKIDRYKKVKVSEKEKILDSICVLYMEYKTSFLGIVILNNLMSIDKLDILPEPETTPERELLFFANLIQHDNKQAVLSYLSKEINPGLHEFLIAWYVWYKGVDKLPKEFKLTRMVEIERLTKETIAKTKDLQNVKKAEFISTMLVEWKSPLEYEVGIRLILEEYEKNPDLISILLEKLLLEHIPSEVPPPYSRNHTVFQEICLIAIITQDKRLADTISTMITSTNSYVAHKSSVVLKWIQEGGVKYPYKYEILKRAYSSQS